jgi:hypothetical protein
MEEKKDMTSTVIGNLLKKKKGTGKKVTETSTKDLEATARVQELLKNTPVAALVGAPVETKSEFNVEEHKQVKSQKWLENQVDQLSQQVEQYEIEIFQYKEEIKRLRDGDFTPRTNDETLIRDGEEFYNPQFIQNNQVNSGGMMNEANAQLEQNVIELFKHFEELHMKYNHDGNFSVRISHPQSGNGILDKILQYLPFLDRVKRYNHFNKML